jgi:signal transduction histidine kinase
MDNGETAAVDIAGRFEEITSPESPRMLKGVQDLVRKDRWDAE